MAQDFKAPYPRYDVLSKWNSPSWNDRTREVVAARLEQLPQRRFFSLAEWGVLEAVCRCLIPQPERSSPVPIVPWIDHKLACDTGVGYRYADLPPQREAWRRGLAAIDGEARRRAGRGFADLPSAEQAGLLADVQQGRVSGNGWRGLPPDRFFKIHLLTEVADVYYSHPAAWSEIGYGGPASPRGYVRMEANRADPWEAGR